jgi:hypothetical protein
MRHVDTHQVPGSFRAPPLDRTPIAGVLDETRGHTSGAWKLPSPPIGHPPIAGVLDVRHCGRGAAAYSGFQLGVNTVILPKEGKSTGNRIKNRWLDLLIHSAY